MVGADAWWEVPYPACIISSNIPALMKMCPFVYRLQQYAAKCQQAPSMSTEAREGENHIGRRKGHDMAARVELTRRAPWVETKE